LKKEIPTLQKEEIKERAIEYLKNHRILTMATATTDGVPDATALEYASDGLDVFVSVRPNSKKIKNIRENPRVFYEIHDDIDITMDSVKNIEALQVVAKPKIIEPDDPTYERLFSIMEDKFPVFKRIPRKTRFLLHFSPKILWYLNYRNKLFHRDKIEF